MGKLQKYKDYVRRSSYISDNISKVSNTKSMSKITQLFKEALLGNKDERVIGEFVLLRNKEQGGIEIMDIHARELFRNKSNEMHSYKKKEMVMKKYTPISEEDLNNLE